MTENESTDSVRTLTKIQRRVLGVLVEKAFTTPEYYPLTLKALTTGCNQKSNRSPVVSYSEDDIEESIEQLREMGLCAEVHTDGGRSARYRHYMRRCFTWSEPQLAIMTELFLRGGQQLGELRTRASRMVAIADKAALRDALAGLLEASFIQSSGDLARRGIEVDHGFYTEQEASRAAKIPGPPAVDSTNPPAAPPEPVDQQDSALAELRREVAALRAEVSELRSLIE